MLLSRSERKGSEAKTNLSESADEFRDQAKIERRGQLAARYVMQVQVGIFLSAHLSIDPRKEQFGTSSGTMISE